MSDNRTHEFLALANSLPISATPASSSGMLSSLTHRHRGGNGDAAPPSGNSVNSNSKQQNNPAYQELRTFHTTAAGISRDIASTSALLTELTDLVRHGGGGAFDPHQEQPRMNQLVVRIKSSIENLNSRLDQASRQIQQQKRRLGQQASEEAVNRMDGLQTMFAEAANDFKKVLQERTETMKEQTDFQKQVYDYHASEHDDDPIPNMSMLSPPPVFGSSQHSFHGLDLTSGLMAAGEATGSSLPRPHGISPVYGGGAAASANSMGPSSEMRQRRPPDHYASYSSQASYSSAYGTAPPLTPLDIQRMEEEMHGQQLQLIPDQDYLQQRADAMSQVEANIVELGTIFNKLAVMVHEHRELVQRVDDNVQDANTNINLSLNVLTDTLTSLRSNRMLALRIFSVLVLFIIGFIIFFA